MGMNATVLAAMEFGDADGASYSLNIGLRNGTTFTRCDSFAWKSGPVHVQTADGGHLFLDESEIVSVEVVWNP